MAVRNRVFNYRRKTTDTIKQTEAENMTSHFAARLQRSLLQTERDSMRTLLAWSHVRSSSQIFRSFACTHLHPRLVPEGIIRDRRSEFGLYTEREREQIPGK